MQIPVLNTEKNRFFPDFQLDRHVVDPTELIRIGKIATAFFRLSFLPSIRLQIKNDYLLQSFFSCIILIFALHLDIT